MAAQRTIQSPGVEIREIDLSLRPNPTIGTTVLIVGFAPQGPIDEVFQPTSFTEFEQIYGKPTNAAERYFYHSARAAFQSNANILTTRIPYGSGSGLGTGNDYSAMFFPVYGYNGEDTVTSSVAAGVSLSAVSTAYVFGKPSLVTLTQAQYNQISQGQFNWFNTVSVSATFSSDSTTWGKAGLIILNTSKTVINDNYEGYYVAISDNYNLNPATNFDAVVKQYTITPSDSTLTVEVPDARRNFALSAISTNYGSNSISEIVENIPSFDISTSSYDDTLILTLFKVRKTVFGDALKLDNVLTEAYVGSLDSFRKVQRENGGEARSFFLGDVEDSSPNIKVLVNPNISTNSGTWLNAQGTPTKKVRFLSRRIITDSAVVNLSAYIGIKSSALNGIATYTSHADALWAFGNYQTAVPSNKVIGAIPTKLSRLFNQIDNIEAFPIDITIEAGLGTIFVGSRNVPTLSGANVFDDTVTITLGESTDTSNTGFYQLRETMEAEAQRNIRDDYLSVFNEFKSFAESKRKDHIFVADPLRYFFVQGENFKTFDDKSKTFTQHVYWPLRHLFGSISTSYACTYANWGRTYDGNIDSQVWLPFSGVIASIMANNDQINNQWSAPAGFEAGRVGFFSDIAVVPSMKQRDLLYKISVNPITQFPVEGTVVYGQKTLYKVPSAFDRINVRRLFLNLEKSTYNTVKYFVFKPNTLLTRTQVVNTLSPIFEFAKNNEGVYDYLIVCDTRNNTPDVIDQNELKVDIYLKPVRTAEFILVNFYATRTGANFEELIQ